MSAETLLLVVAVVAITAWLPRALVWLTVAVKRRRAVPLTIRIEDETTHVLDEEGRLLATVPNVVAVTRDAKGRPSIVAVGERAAEGESVHLVEVCDPRTKGLDGAWEAFVLYAGLMAVKPPDGGRPPYVVAEVEARVSDPRVREAVGRDLARRGFRVLGEFRLSDRSSAKST